MSCWQLDFLLLIDPRIYSQIYPRTPCLALLICKVVYLKKEVRLFQILKKERLFISYDNQVLWGKLTMWHPLLHPPKKAFLSSSVWLRREYTWALNWGAYWFVLKIARVFPIPTSRNTMMSTFIIANITPTCKRISLCFSTPTKSSFSVQFGQVQNILGVLSWQKSLLICASG